MLELVTLTAGSGGRGEVWGELERAILAGEEGSLLYLCATRPLLEETRRRLLEQPGVPGLGRLRMVLFQGLIDLILREDVQAVAPLQPAVRDALLGAVLERLVRESKLNRLAPIAATRGLARSIAGLVAELKRANVRPGAWRAAAASRANTLETDLAEVYEAYQQALERMDTADPDDLGLWALDTLVRTGGAFFRGDPSRGTQPIRRVLVDGYQDFTPVQLAWLRVAAALVPQVTVYMEYDPDRPELYQSAEATVRALEEVAGGSLPLRAAPPDGWTEGATPAEAAMVPESQATLRLLAEELFRPRSRRSHSGATTPAAPAAGVEPAAGIESPAGVEPAAATVPALQVLAAQDDASEARELARLIRQALAADPSLAARDIAVIYRELGPEADLLARELERAGVPVSRRASLALADIPVVRAALRLLQAAANPERFDNILAAAKTGYLDLPGLTAFESVARQLGTGISTQQWRDRLEAALARLQQEQAAARGGGAAAGDQDQELQGWRIARDLQRHGAARRLLNELLRRLGRWPRPLPLAEAARRTADTVARLGLREATLGLLRRGEVPQDEAAVLVARDLAGLEGLQNAASALEQALAAAGLQDVEPDRWLADLEQTLRLTEVALPGLAPRGHDAVQILAAPAARRLRFRLVALAGLADGRFPKRFNPDWLLPDREREALQAQGLGLETRRDLASAERLHFYQAATCATERLVLSYPAAAADGAAQLPSPFVTEAVELFPRGAVPVVGPAPGQLWPGDLGQAASLEELRQMVMRRAAGQGAPAAAAALRQALTEAGSLGASLWPRLAAQAEREGNSWGAHDGRFLDASAQSALSRRYHDDYSFSASQLGAYGTCPFRFYAERVLRLLPLDEAGEEADPMEVGSLYHQILFTLWDGHRGEPIDPRQRDTYRRELTAIAAAALEAYEARGIHANQGLWAVKRREILNRLFTFLDWELDLIGGLAEAPRPTLLEVGFGMPGQDPGSRLEPVRLGTGADEAGEADGGASASGSFWLKGKIDRVDQTEDGGFLVIDYKTSGTPKVKDMREGRDLQVPLYLRAAQALLGEGAHPIGGGYQSIRQQSRTQGLWRKGEAERTGVSRGSGVVADEEWESLLAESVAVAARYVAAIRRGDFPVAPNGECPPLCPYQRICRWEPRRIERKEPVRAGEGGDTDGAVD